MGTAIRPESKIERDRDGISFHNWHALLWDTVHIFSQERRRSKPRATGSPSSILLRFPFWLQTAGQMQFLRSTAKTSRLFSTTPQKTCAFVALKREIAINRD